MKTYKLNIYKIYIRKNYFICIWKKKKLLPYKIIFKNKNYFSPR